MAEENNTSQEKTEAPSEKKLRDAKNNGQAPRSKELTTFITLITFLALTYFFSAEIAEAMISPVKKVMDLGNITEDIASDNFALLKELGINFFWLAMTCSLTMMVIQVIATFALGGFIFSWKPLSPNFSKLDPIKGIGRMFSLKSLMELIKSLLKFILLAGTATLIFYNTIDSYITISVENVDIAIATLAKESIIFLLIVASAFIIVPTIDAPFQVMQFTKQLKMTKQEVKDEHKETDGRPEVKAKVREIQRQMANQRSIKAIPEADVIIVNPTHYSIALKFDAATNVAPVVIGKGVEEIALRMRELGGKSRLPVISSPVVARSLYYYVEIDEAIPKQLFHAVAAIYRFIGTLERKQRAKPIKIKELEKLTVPNEFYRE